MIKEFKTFIMRGNVMELAVGIIIGASFNKIVQSLVNDIITPIISFLMGLFTIGGFSLEAWSVTLSEGAVLNIGMFIALTIDFLITAFAVFMIIKIFNKLNDAANMLPPVKILRKSKKDEDTTDNEAESDNGTENDADEEETKEGDKAK